MRAVNAVLDPAFTTGPVRRQTFGTFVERLGRCVYTGIYEPDHPAADEDGFRKDVLALVGELRISTVRYPGGNFVSGYRWEDGVGLREGRPRRPNLAWHSTEPNTFGTDEFMRWCAKAGVEPMMAVNLGTRGIQDAVDLLEYCNLAGGTALSDQRLANPVRGADVVPGQRDGRHLADRVQDRHRGRAAGRRDRTRHAHGRLHPRAGRLRLLLQPAQPSAPGNRRCWPRRTTRSTSSPPTPTTRPPSESTCPSTSGTSAPAPGAVQDADRRQPAGGTRAARGPLQRRGRGRRRQPAHQPAAQQRPGALGLPGAAQLVNAVAPIMTEPGGRAWRRSSTCARSVPLLGSPTRSPWPTPTPSWQARADDDTTVAPRHNATAAVEENALSVELPAVFWSLIRLAV